MIKELIIAQQICYVCIPPPQPPGPEPPPCPRWSQVSNPAACRQNGVSFIVDGCSIPAQIANALAGGNRNNPVRGTVNFGSTAFGVEQGSILPAFVHTISQLPCNQHDKCYKTCGMTQGICDLGFGQGLNAVCTQAYPNVLDCQNFMPPLNSPIRCALYATEAAKCAFIAGTMAGAVALAGRSAYRENQDRHCNCCNAR
jgi:hypothetical protein